MSTSMVGRRIAGWGLWLSLAAGICRAQQPVVQIIGGGTPGVPAGGVSATSIGLTVGPVKVDSAGNVYTVASDRVYVVNTSGKASVVAGTGVSGFSDGGGIALDAQFGEISDIAIDTDGSLYIADLSNLCVWKVNTGNGTIVRFAGVGSPTSQEFSYDSGDGGPANQAPMSNPFSLALDHKGSLYISTSVGLRKVTLSTGIITTFPFFDSWLNVAWTQEFSMAIDPTGSTLYFVADGIYQVDLCTGAISSTFIPYLGTVALDQQGNLYVIQFGDGIYRVPSGASSGTEIIDLSNLSTTYPFLANEGTGGIAVDSSNNLYFSYGVLWKSNTSGAAPAIYAGDGSGNYNGDGPALQSTFSSVQGMAADQSGNVYMGDTGNNRVRKINLATGMVTTVAGTSVAGYNGDSQPASSAQLNSPTCLALSGQNLYIADTGNNRIRQVNLSSGTITTLVSQSNGPARFSPACIALDGEGNLYVQESVYHSFQLDKVPLNGAAIVSYPAPASPTGDILGYPIAADGSGNIYVAYDSPAYAIYRLTNGTWTVFAGTGAFGDSGDGGPASQATFGAIGALAYDGQGNLFLSDFDNYRVRRISLSDGIIHAVTLDPGPAGYYPLLEQPAFSNLTNGQPVGCALAPATALTADGKGNFFYSPGGAPAASAQAAPRAPGSSWKPPIGQRLRPRRWLRPSVFHRQRWVLALLWMGRR